MPPVDLIKHKRVPICDVFKSLCTVKGSVIPRSLLFAVPCAALSLVLKLLQNNDSLPSFLEGMDIMENNAAYTGFSFAMGFLFVFRTSQAYSRFWEGVTAGHRMYAEWFDFASAVVAFSRYSTASEKETARFHHRLVRLLSLLHGGASSTLSGEDASNFEIIDLGGLDAECVNRVVLAEHPTTLIAQWIQELVVEGLHDGVISAPPPIVSRCFQEFANGMVAFHDAIKIQSTQFPFPYTQMAGLLLLAHAFVTPFVMCQWVTWPSWVFFLTFMQVLIFWSLYFTAVEIEFPFRAGDLSHDTAKIQIEFNKQLLTLISPETRQIPDLNPHVSLSVAALFEDRCEVIFKKHSITQRVEKFRPFKNLRRSNNACLDEDADVIQRAPSLKNVRKKIKELTVGKNREAILHLKENSSSDEARGEEAPVIEIGRRHNIECKTDDSRVLNEDDSLRSSDEAGSHEEEEENGVTRQTETIGMAASPPPSEGKLSEHAEIPEILTSPNSLSRTPGPLRTAL